MPFLAEDVIFLIQTQRNRGKKADGGGGGVWLWERVRVFPVRENSF